MIPLAFAVVGKQQKTTQVVGVFAEVKIFK